jgi:hypothetical protein
MGLCASGHASGAEKGVEVTESSTNKQHTLSAVDVCVYVCVCVYTACAHAQSKIHKKSLVHAYVHTCTKTYTCVNGAHLWHVHTQPHLTPNHFL